MGRIAYTVGCALVGLSALSVLQTVRELMLWRAGDDAYTEESKQERLITFGGHTFTVVDDQPVAPTHSYEEFEGRIQPMMDGRPLAPSSRARVRRGLTDLGRYFSWFDAWVFRERSTGRSSLWLARRLQPVDGDRPQFEVVSVSQEGAVNRRVIPGWRLSADYRLYRSTQFVREGTWSAMPLALGDVIGLFPLLLLIFPIGTSIVGAELMRRHSKAHLRAPAG